MKRTSVSIVAVLSVIVGFTACGGGGGSSSTAVGSSGTVTGKFIDSPVEGLEYLCSSGLSGVTNSKGQYICNTGDSVTFSLGELILGSVKAQSEFITPYSLFPESNEAAINLARLLQTLDSDNNPENNIKLDTALVKRLTKDMKLRASDFVSIAEAKLGKTLKDKKSALAHMQETINNAGGNSTNFDASQKHFLYDLFTTEYLWADMVDTTIDYAQFTTPKSMIKSLRYSKRDKWSYSQTMSEFEDENNQASTGIGCYMDDWNYIVYKDIDSPCDRVGLKRGDKIIEYDNKTMIVDRDAQRLTFTVTSQAYNYKVSKSQIINQNGKKIGHMIFNEFTGASVDEIEDAFTYFKNEKIDELIVDLRYNGGGSLNTASVLLDKIAGYGRDEQLQGSEVWNSNFFHKNTEYRFMEDKNSLENLSRVFFLTTEYTASASEIVINALQPYMEVITIGSKTRGKNVGMRGRKYKGLIYWLINMEFKNSDNESYSGGIDATYEEWDYMYIERTSKEDPLLAKALSLIE